MLAALSLLVPTLAARVGDPSWRAFSIPLDTPTRHTLEPGADGLARLNGAREAYLVLDLHIPGGDPSGLRLDFDGGLSVPGTDLRPTMPGFGLATHRGGLDPRSFRQWWRVRWQPGMADQGRVALQVRGPGEVRLFGGLVTPGEESLRLGPSFGEWPHASVYRLMHDGEYRLATRHSLSSASQESFLQGDSLPGRLAIHLVILDDDAGGAEWETAPAPASEVVTAVWARAGRAARADLLLPGGPLRLDFEDLSPTVADAGEVRIVPTGEYEGWFLIRTRATPGAPLRLAVRPLQEMSSVPKYFLPEQRRGPPPFPPAWAGLSYVPVERILKARAAPRWRVREVY